MTAKFETLEWNKPDNGKIEMYLFGFMTLIFQSFIYKVSDARETDRK